MLLSTAWKGNPRLRLLCGGEALPRQLADQLLNRGKCLWNMYGPTETTVWSTLQRVEAGTGPVPIGRPIANTQVYVLRADFSAFAVGEIGSLYIGGAGLTRGYRNRPDLTAEHFVPDPFSGQPGARLYHTGDLARFLPDGTLECLGRVDHQVKVRGFRIELGEIETVLGSHSAVRETVVAARTATTGETQLAAYFVPRSGSSPSISELRQFLGERLPEYMVPTDIEMLSSLPLTPNGKIDRKALPAPHAKTRSSAAA
jgi:acyl-coenzyme A synthetase/AMP-(fatty) acid ligase